jgi:hypothetical protein
MQTVLPSNDFARGEHLLCEVAGAVARGFGAQRAAAPVAALAGERAREFVAQAFVLPEHEAYFTAADADVACRDVGVLSDVALQFGHERLAELHHFVVRAALGVEIRTALAAAHGQRRQAVLEGLFEGEELQDRQVDRRVEADAALVGANRHAVLDAVATVDLHRAVVVHPGHAEHDDALGLHQALQQAVIGVAGMLFDERPQALHHFRDRLEEFRLTGVALSYLRQEAAYGLVLHIQRAFCWVEKKRGPCGTAARDYAKRTWENAPKLCTNT